MSIVFDNNDLFIQRSGLYRNRMTVEEKSSFLRNDLFGGAKSKVIKSNTEPSTYLKIMPTFINTLKSKIVYRGLTKLSLEKMNHKDPVVLGTIVDLSKIERELEKSELKKKDVLDYLKQFDMVPLLYNDNSDLTFISREDKKSIFNLNSKLCFITFDINNITSYYVEVPTKEVRIKPVEVEEVIKEKNYMVSHYIFDNYFFLAPTNKLKLKSFSMINFNSDGFEFEKVDDLDYEPNGRKISIKEMNLAIREAKKELSVFSL